MSHVPYRVVRPTAPPPGEGGANPGVGPGTALSTVLAQDLSWFERLQEADTTWGPYLARHYPWVLEGLKVVLLVALFAVVVVVVRIRVVRSAPGK